MPKAIIDSVRGVNQTAGVGFTVAGMPISYFNNGTTYTTSNDPISVATDIAVVNVSGGNDDIELENGSNPGAVKIIVVGTAGGGQLRLKNDDGSDIGNQGNTANVPGVVQAGEVFMCIYTGVANKWFLLE